VRKLAAALTFVLVAAATALAGQHWTQAGATVLTLVNTSSGEHHWTPDKPLFILLLGDDIRPGAGCGCTDSIHVVGIPAGGGSAVFLDIPRDTRVNLPGFGMHRINEAWGRAKTDKEQYAAQVVGALVGVKIDYTMLIGFTDLPKLVNELGGVTVNVPEKMADPNSGAFFPKGPVNMNGDQALAFSRNRHIGAGDFTRSSNQTVLMLAMLSKLRGLGSDPPSELKYLSVLARHSVLNGVSNTDLYRLGRLALSIDPANVRNVIMPGTTAMFGGGSFVVTTSASAPLFADFADDAILQTH
jgi:polyisoprenyl-teichoic acid--peptidoglycan teichoic acid transferase